MTLTVEISKKPQVLMGENYFNHDFSQLKAHGEAFTYENDTKEEMREKIGQLLDKMIYPLRPKLYNQVFFLERGDVVEQVRLSVKPIGNFRIEGLNLLQQIHVVVGENLYKDLAVRLAEWFENYNAVYCSTINAQAFTAKVQEIAAESKIVLPYNIVFKHGRGILAVDNFNIEIGVPTEVLATLEHNPVFYKGTADDYAYISERSVIAHYISEVAEKGLIYAVRDSLFTQKYGIATNEFAVQVSNLVRLKLATDASKLRKGLNVYRGTASVEGANYVAILDVQPVTEDEAKQYGDLVVTFDNPRQTKAEIEAGQTKYAVYFVLQPTPKSVDVAENEEFANAIKAVTLADITATIK